MIMGAGESRIKEMEGNGKKRKQLIIFNESKKF